MLLEVRCCCGIITDRGTRRVRLGRWGRLLLASERAWLRQVPQVCDLTFERLHLALRVRRRRSTARSRCALMELSVVKMRPASEAPAESKPKTGLSTLT